VGIKRTEKNKIKALRSKKRYSRVPSGFEPATIITVIRHHNHLANVPILQYMILKDGLLGT